MSELLRVYLDPAEIGLDGYPYAWHGKLMPVVFEYSNGICRTADELPPEPQREPAIKDLVREQAGHRCERCGHPYTKGNPANSPRSEWTPCDDRCTHGPPRRSRFSENTEWRLEEEFGTLPRFQFRDHRVRVDAQWRILTVHHLNGIKHDCRWWNLTALCQRCHLAIQGRVVMERVWPWEHSEWFKPHAAGWYAAAYLDEDLSREETMARLHELLDLERVL